MRRYNEEEFTLSPMTQRLIAIVLLIGLSPVFGILWMVHRFTMGGDFIFSQKRAGKNQKPFEIYKIRTMVPDAEAQKKQLANQNEADGPVFKMRNDPRYTPFGKWLSHSGLDELPQLWNIVKGDMAFVGPRPLLLDEIQNVPIKYARRFSVLPGVTSMWVLEGAHNLTFSKWMNLDVLYVRTRSAKIDIIIALRTIRYVFISLLLSKNVPKSQVRNSQAHNKPLTIGLISSKGGHLIELMQLKNLYKNTKRFWVTVPGEDSAYYLKYEKNTYFAFHSDSRNIMSSLLNVILAFKIFFSEKPSVLISCGAGVAVPFFLIGKFFFRTKLIYIESFVRVDYPSLTGRILHSYTDLFFVQHKCQKKWYPRAHYLGSLL